MSTEITLESLLAEEEALQIDTFDYDFIWALGSRIRGEASEKNLPVAIEICRGSEPAFFCICPGASPNNHHWAQRKRNVVLRFGHSSLYWRLHSDNAGVNFNTRQRVPDTEYAASGGGVPLIARNAGLVGVAAVSGLVDVEDHRLITTCLAELLGKAKP